MRLSLRSADANWWITSLIQMSNGICCLLSIQSNYLGPIDNARAKQNNEMVKPKIVKHPPYWHARGDEQSKDNQPNMPRIRRQRQTNVDGGWFASDDLMTAKTLWKITTVFSKPPTSLDCLFQDTTTFLFVWVTWLTSMKYPETRNDETPVSRVDTKIWFRLISLLLSCSFIANFMRASAFRDSFLQVSLTFGPISRQSWNYFFVA